METTGVPGGEFLVQRLKFNIYNKEFEIESRDFESDMSSYISTLNSNYFTYKYASYLGNRPDDNSEMMHIALRHLYAQVIESNIALLCASLQTLWAIPAWMILYRNPELKKMAQVLKDRGRLPKMKLDFNPEVFAETLVFRCTGKTKEIEEYRDLILGLQYAIEYMINDHLDVNFQNEYNSIKHGNRVNPGAVQIAFQAEGSTDWHTFKMESGLQFSTLEKDEESKIYSFVRHTTGFSILQIRSRIEIAIKIFDIQVACIATRAKVNLGLDSLFLPTLESVRDAWTPSDENTLTHLSSNFPT